MLIDRDGTINVDTHYAHDPAELQFEHDVLTGMQFLARLRIPIIIHSNQGGVAAGLFTLDQMDAFNAEIVRRIEEVGGRIDAIYACPHLEPKFQPNGEFSCDCMKPRTGLLEEAAADFDLDLERCVVVGDTTKDMAAANRVGSEAMLVLSGKCGYDEEAIPHYIDLKLGSLVELAGRLAERKSRTGEIAWQEPGFPAGSRRRDEQKVQALRSVPDDAAASGKAAWCAVQVADYILPGAHGWERGLAVEMAIALSHGKQPTRAQFARYQGIAPYVWREWPRATGSDGAALDCLRAALDFRLTGCEALTRAAELAKTCLKRQAPERLDRFRAELYETA